MFARLQLVSMVAEGAERYFKGIEEGGSLYDATDIPVMGLDPRQ